MNDINVDHTENHISSPVIECVQLANARKWTSVTQIYQFIGKFCLFHSALALVLNLSACGDSSQREQLVITGASTPVPILMHAADVMESRNPNLRVHVQPGGSSKGIRDTIEGHNDLGAVARELSPAEREQVHSIPIARDGVVIVTHASNSLTSLTKNELFAIYMGEIDNWRTLTGADRAITLVHKAAGHGTRAVFSQYLGVKGSQIKPHVVAGNNTQVIKTIAASANSVGYVSLADVIAAVEIGTPIKAIELEGVAPTLANVANGSWPIARTLYLVSKQATIQSWAEAMVEFLRSEEGSRIIEGANYVPLKPTH